jgi:carbon-monoxide dehydrogenase small subunit
MTMIERIPLRMSVNGLPVSIEVEQHRTLLECLRDELNMTGTKQCCSEGECGACTVLLNGKAVVSCLVLAAESEGSEVVTIEGLERDEHLDRLQESFVQEGAVQCGFCIPGMIMSAKYLLMKNGRPTVAEIREGLAGNLCRCGGYSRIARAVQVAAEAAQK